VALLSTIVVAMIDEWHQSFLGSRTGALPDVILDGSAALLGQIALFVVLRSE
jgi:VanZ family protein